MQCLDVDEYERCKMLEGHGHVRPGSDPTCIMACKGSLWHVRHVSSRLFPQYSLSYQGHAHYRGQGTGSPLVAHLVHITSNISFYFMHDFEHGQMPEARPFKDARRWHMPISFRGTSISIQLSLLQSYMNILARSYGLKHALIFFLGQSCLSLNTPLLHCRPPPAIIGIATQMQLTSRAHTCAREPPEVRRSLLPFLLRCLEPCQPGRIAPPTWAVAAASFTDEDRKLSEELRSIVAPSQGEGAVTTLLHNQSGLNGLATSGVEGLDSVSLSAVSILFYCAAWTMTSVCLTSYLATLFVSVSGADAHSTTLLGRFALHTLSSCIAINSLLRGKLKSNDVIGVLSRGCSEIVVPCRVSSGFLQHNLSTT